MAIDASAPRSRRAIMVTALGGTIAAIAATLGSRTPVWAASGVPVTAGDSPARERVRRQPLTPKVPAGTVTRVAGENWFGTAAAISLATFAPGPSVAYIAAAFDLPDALAAAAAAGTMPGPVLLVNAGLPLPVETTTELARLKPKRIVVLAGPAVISDAVANALKPYAVGG